LLAKELINIFIPFFLKERDGNFVSKYTSIWMVSKLIHMDLKPQKSNFDLIESLITDL